MSEVQPDKEFVKSEIQALIKKYAPARIEEVPNLLYRYHAEEASLYHKLCEKFQAEPSPKIPKPKGRRKVTEHYDVGKKLGSGGFAVVRFCTRKKDSAEFAMKVINKKNLEREDLVTLAQEVKIMKLLDHKNIVRLHDVIESKAKMCLVLDLMSGGELFDRIVDAGHYSENLAAESMLQLMEALNYCHKQSIVHRDLKPENLLYLNKTEHSPLKLIDFGLAGIMPDPNKPSMGTPCGTPNYVAPEVLKRLKYDAKTDIWSAGVILYILLCGFPPFYDEEDDLNRLYKKIKTADFEFPSPWWDEISDDAKDLIKAMLTVEPSKRLSAEQVLKHKWMTGHAPKRAFKKTYTLRLKRFNKGRALRRGINTVLALNKLVHVLKGDSLVD